jgi:GTP-binding protein EngB required for normal cell division
VSRPLDARLEALDAAVELARGRLDEADVDAAAAVVERAGVRLGLGLEATVVALAGPTGAGKSTLFNVLAGEELTRAGHRRPTTAAASAAIWGDVGDALLDWLEVPRRFHRPGAPDGLVLLDLPDFDSVEASHRLEVDRVVGLTDLMVWVLDPQKYADGVLHERYLRPLAGHGEAMVAVLNQADRLDPAALRACVSDLEGLLRADGLAGVPVLAVSATTGMGVDALRDELQRRVAAREAALARLAADVDAVAAPLAAACGGGRPGTLARSDRAALTDALSSAAGVPAIVDAVARSHRRAGGLATGWPFVRWIRRARPDPLRRLRLPGAAEQAELPAGTRSSLPAATPVQRAQVEAATRALAARAAGDLPQPWPGLVRGAALAHEDALTEALERAVAGTDLRPRRPRWWALAGGLQLLLAGVTLVGLLWLLALAGLGFAQLDEVVPMPDVSGIPAPTLLAVGGALAGLLVGFLAGVLVRAGARRRARAAGRALRAPVEGVAAEHVLGPVQTELDVQAQLCEALTRAQQAPTRRLRSLVTN